MKIGIDYGGVISFDVSGYCDVLKKLQEKGHEIFLVSHAISDDDAKSRRDVSEKYGFTDLTFVMPANQEDAIRKRKAEDVKRHSIDVFIDDSLDRCIVVGRENHNCTCIYAPQGAWNITCQILRGL